MEKLLAIMQELRQKCPWDQQQTPESLTRYAIEEAYEVEAAIREGDVDQIRNELGDLLLQVVFQSQMYTEQGAFNFHDVVDAISEKLIRRHPHVFQSEHDQNLNPEQVSELWKQIKISVFIWMRTQCLSANTPLICRQEFWVYVPKEMPRSRLASGNMLFAQTTFLFSCRDSWFHL